MDDSIEWKDAKGGQDFSDEENEADTEDDFKSDAESGNELTGSRDELNDNPVNPDEEQADSLGSQKAAHEGSIDNLQFKLVRNITALSDPLQHKPRENLAKIAPLLNSLGNGLIAISPDGDTLLFSRQSPEKLNFIAKLKMEPFNQYATKRLEIPLDYDEQVTSVLCLPIMSLQRTAIGMVDWNALVFGLSTGYVKFYTEQSVCLLSLKFFETPIVSIKCQTQRTVPVGRSESHFAIVADELLVVSKVSAVVVDGLGLNENLKAAKEDLTRNGSNYEPAYDITNLPIVLACTKWKYDSSQSSIVMDADLFGSRSTSRFDSLKSASINFDHIPPKASGHTLVTVGKSPSIAYMKEPKDNSAHSVKEIIGSLIPFWSKPAVTKLQISDISNPSLTTLYDKDRAISSILSSPDKRLAVTTDSFGRVMLIDVTNWIVIRMWKGYRSAQCGWVEVKRDPMEKTSPYATFLVIYAPKRGILEVWSTQRGPRVAAFNVGKNCRLLYSGYRMLNIRTDVLAKSGNTNLLIDQSYSKNCYLFNLQTETLFSIELPYTYSLYKYGDLKSRDCLLIPELTNAIQNESEVTFISEIMSRISLAESLQVSIQKIAKTLSPDKIIPIMENLINKIMQNYFYIAESMSDDDQSIVELAKRLIRICTVFNQLSQFSPNELNLPDVNQSLVAGYEQHPQEIDEFAEQLGWGPAEVLRYLSLSALERSYSNDKLLNPWPNLGEPLEWHGFVSCFDLNRSSTKTGRNDKAPQNPDAVSIRLEKFTSKFLNEDRVVKTALFMYNRLSEVFYRESLTKDSEQLENESLETLRDCYNCFEPATRLALLFQFWLSTKLCAHWKMWAFLQDQVGKISDELKCIAMRNDDDKIIVDAWRQIYQLILESDNTFAALIATSAIKSDTIRSMNEDESKEDRLESADFTEPSSSSGSQRRLSIDWECLLIDAERMAILAKQLEDVFLLNLLLRYSPEKGHLVEQYTYRVARISVANILRSGSTIVSELVAQWALQSGLNLKIFTKAYGEQTTDKDQEMVISCSPESASQNSEKQRVFQVKSSDHTNEDHAMELLHHAKTAFPLSLDSDIMLINCMWEFCACWTNNRGYTNVNRVDLLKRAFDCLPLLSSVHLRHKLANLVYKTFLQRTFERLVMLVEVNGTIMSSKSWQLRDSLSRKELNMGEESLELFVQFCCDLSELMLQTFGESTRVSEDERIELENRLMSLDDWWSGGGTSEKGATGSEMDNNAYKVNPLASKVLTVTDSFDVDTLVELNRLSNLMNLIFKLRIVKAYPMSLIGEESRKILKIDMQQSSKELESSRSRATTTTSGSLNELRHKFARKCILNIVARISANTNEFNDEDDDSFQQQQQPEDNDIGKQQRDENRMRSGKSRQLFDQQSISSSAFSVATSATNTSEPIGCDKSLAAGQQNSSEMRRNENNESMLIFANLLSLAKEWDLNRDELYLELVFELYRCNHDKFASQISTRVHEQQTLANGLLKICSQRVLVLFGLSPYVSQSDWRKRTDKWSVFQPNVSSWLRSIQQEELRREIAALNFVNTATSKQASEVAKTQNVFGVEPFILQALRRRTKLVLESSTNHLDGQAARLAYDLLQLLESSLIDKLWSEELS